MVQRWEHYARAKLGASTLVPHLAFGLVSATAHHTNMFGIHCYVRSWKDAGTPNAPLMNPNDIFDAIYGTAFQNSVSKDAQRKRRLRSILDGVVADFKSATSDRGNLGRVGSSLLSDHLESIRQLERQVLATDLELTAQCQVKPRSPGNVLGAIPYGQWDPILKLQIDLFVQALACDITRFGSISFGECAEYYTNPSLGAKSGHQAAHDSERATYQAYIRHYMGLAAYLASRLAGVQEANGTTALDNSVT